MTERFLTGKTCLVTGGGQGVGWATAQALADFGANVYVGELSPENINAAQAELAGSPWKNQIHFRQCDVSVRSEVEEWILDIHKATGRIDVIVNNAAFARWEYVTETQVEEMERMMAVSYYGVVYSTKIALPLMLSAGQGHFVNVSSSAGKMFVGGRNAAYAAAKAAVDGFTQMLALELKGTGVHATVVRLGPVAGTDFFRKHVSNARVPRLGDFLPSLTPPLVAAGILRALRTKQTRLDLPGYLPIMYLLFDLAPNLLVKMVGFGGDAQKDYSAVQWKYESKGN